MNFAKAFLIAALAATSSAFGADVTGFVNAKDGAPVSGASVIAYTTASHEQLAQTKSIDGEFAFSGLPDAVVELEVRAEGFEPSTALAIPGRIPVSIVVGTDRAAPQQPKKMTPGDRTLTGIVRVDGKPLAGVPLMLQGPQDVMRVVTDAKGRYTASALAPGRYYIGITPELQRRLRRPYDAELTSEEGPGMNDADLTEALSATIDLNVIATATIYGRVLDADKKPVSNAAVQVILAGRSSTDFYDEPVGRTSKDGRYAIAAPPFQSAETSVVTVTLPAHEVIASKPFKTDTTDHEIDITLPRFETVTLRVADRAGKPVRAARVAFATTGETVPLFGRTSRVFPTDDTGNAIVYVTPGQWDFGAVAKDFQPTIVEERVITKAATIAMTLDPAFTIRGRVHRGDLPVPTASIILLGGERTPRRDTEPLVTDAKGEFAITDLPRGKQRVLVMKQDELLQRVVETEAPATLDIALPPAGRLRVRVIDAATHEPVRNFVYSIEPAEVIEEIAGDSVPTLQRGMDDSDGHFEATLSRGAYRVSAAADGFAARAPLEVRVRENETLDLTLSLDRGLNLTGRVLDQNESPIAGADIYVDAADPVRPGSSNAARTRQDQATSARDGSFTVTGIEARHVSVVVRAPGYVPLRKVLDLDGTPSFEARLSRGLSIEGVVRRGGKPVPNVPVNASTAAEGGLQQMEVSDAQGRFTLRGLVAGRYTISAYTNESTTDVKNVDPTEDRLLVISLDPKPMGVLFGTVMGIPPAVREKFTRRVVFVEADGWGTEAMVDDAGNYRIEEMPAGIAYATAQIETPSGGRASLRTRVDVRVGQETRLDLDVSADVRVRGRVTYGGKPAAGVRVVFGREQGIAGSASSGNDGSFEAGLPVAGTYQIFAHSELLSAGNVQLVREIRGGENIDIELREQAIEGTVVDAITHEPLRGISVTLMADPAMYEAYAGQTFTDTNGRFRILTASRGAYRLTAWGLGYAQRTQVLQLGESEPSPLSLEMTKAADLRVRIVDAKSGVPLIAQLTLSNVDGTYVPLRGESTPDQAYLFTLAPGKYLLNVVVEGYADRDVEITAPGSIDIAM